MSERQQDAAAGGPHAARLLERGICPIPLQFLGILNSARSVRRNDLPAGALNGADDRQGGRAMLLERESSQMRRARSLNELGFCSAP